jgi:uncharacterized membrane protein
MDMMYSFMNEQLIKLKPSHADLLSKRSLLLPLMLWMSIFNNIIVPFIAMAIISPSCFYYVFYPAPPVSATVDFTGCTEVIRLKPDGSGYTTLLKCNAAAQPYTISYDPPFQYSFQCTSALLRSFMSIFLYRYLLNGAVMPVSMMILKLIQEHILEIYGWESHWFHLISIVIPMELRPLSKPPEFFKQSTKKMSLDEESSPIDLKTDPMMSESNEENPIKSSAATLERPHSIKHALTKSISDAVNFQMFTLEEFNKFLGVSADSQISFGFFNMMIDFATDIAILLTFGTMFPPLAVVGCATIWLRTINIQLIIGRVVYLSKSQPYLLELCKELNEECVGISKMLINCLLSLPLLLAMSWSWFLFDIWGDVAGYYPAVLVWLILPMMAMVVLPVLISLKQRTMKKFIEEMNEHSNASHDEIKEHSNNDSIASLDLDDHDGAKKVTKHEPFDRVIIELTSMQKSKNTSTVNPMHA